MSADDLTPGIVFAIDELLRTRVHREAAGHLVNVMGLKAPESAAVIRRMLEDEVIPPTTVAFIDDPTGADDEEDDE